MHPATSCSGITYFTTAMRERGTPPRCLGRRGTMQVDVPQRELIERSAREDVVDFRYFCFGYSQSTEKMKQEGALPLCDVGMRFMVLKSDEPVKEVSVLNFWKRGFDDFPNKWQAFNHRLLTAMKKHALFLLKTITRLGNFWTHR